MTGTPRAAASAASASNHGVPGALIRTIAVPPPSSHVPTAARAVSLSAGATASSRSSSTTSAPLATALPKRSGRSPGTNRNVVAVMVPQGKGFRGPDCVFARCGRGHLSTIVDSSIGRSEGSGMRGDWIYDWAKVEMEYRAGRAPAPMRHRRHARASRNSTKRGFTASAWVKLRKWAPPSTTTSGSAAGSASASSAARSTG